MIEAVEIAARFVVAWMKGTTEQEYFHRTYGGPGRRVSTEGVYFSPFPPPRPAAVSVIVLSLDAADVLRAMFASVAEYNSWNDLEIIVVDHGGEAATADVVSEASARFQVHHIVPGRNHSFAFSCNRAAQIARGEILLFLNNDVEFADDIVPRIVAAVQATEGLIGVKLRYKGPAGTISETPQIGVRFRWNLGQGWTVPYDALSTPRDAVRVNYPSRMPVVTGAVLGCDRSRFLQLGGFCEDYLYAYEDVDLGIKADALMNLPSISLNDTVVHHLFGATRRRRSSRKRRAIWHCYNRSIFRSRNGYRNRRMAWLGFFGVSNFEWERGLAVALVAARPSTWDRDIAASLEESYADYVPLKDNTFSGRNLYGYDLIVFREPAATRWPFRHLGPMALCIAWIRSADEEWTAEDVAGCHLVVAETAALATSLAGTLGRHVYTLDSERNPTDALKDTLVSFLEEKWRFALLGSDGTESADELAAALLNRGHSATRRKLRDISVRYMAGDDVVIWFSPAPKTMLQPDQIHVAAFQDPLSTRGRKYDLVLPRGTAEFDEWLTALLGAVQEIHDARMKGPFDPPLADLRDSAADAAALWRSYPDPTEELLLRS